jgi:hypothetical protein
LKLWYRALNRLRSSSTSEPHWGLPRHLHMREESDLSRLAIFISEKSPFYFTRLQNN